MQAVYIIDNAGKGPVMGYDPKKYEKLSQSFKKSGYRKATIEELSRFKNIELLPEKEVKEPVKEKPLQGTEEKKNN